MEIKGAFLLKKGGQKSWSALLIGSLIFIALGIVILVRKISEDHDFTDLFRMGAGL